MPSAVIALLLVVAVLVGLGIGHGVWTADRSSSSVPQGGSGGVTDPFQSPNSNGSGTPNNSNGSQSLTAPQEAVAGELVDIDVALSYQEDEAEGTGIVLTSNGLILTNNHVISGSTSISAVDIGNGKSYQATVVGYDRTQDVALIQLQGASGLKTATIGSSSQLSVGQSVVGIGNAGGTGGAPSTAPGQITALDQSITAQDESTGTSEPLSGLVETNCDIEPGDSGGPLVNSAGTVVGMDTAATVGFQFQGSSGSGDQGYSIPINQAMSIVKDIEAGRASSTVHVGATAFLGVEVQAQNNTGVTGALVQSVIQGGAAQAAGIAANDVITGFGGSTITSPDDLTKVISQAKPGQQVRVTWTNPSGASHTAQVTLASGPPQ